jgi:hypothetical protein
MTQKTFKIATIALAGLVVSGCTFPNFDQLNLGQETEKVDPAAEVAAVQQPQKPKWAHQRIGNTAESGGGGAPDLSGGDEDGGWN